MTRCGDMPVAQARLICVLCAQEQVFAEFDGKHWSTIVPSVYDCQRKHLMEAHPDIECDEDCGEYFYTLKFDQHGELISSGDSRYFDNAYCNDRVIGEPYLVNRKT